MDLRKRFYLKNANVIERLAQIDTIVFDKTGTLTEGRFSVAEVKINGSEYSRSDVLNLIANIEQFSEHPIARAFKPYLTAPLPLTETEISVG